MRLATAEEFLTVRFGPYAVGRHHLVWCRDPSLGGSVFWGRPAVEDLEALSWLYGFQLSAADPEFDVVTDGSRLEAIAPEVFQAFLRT
jgi:hypothetical protein